MSENTSNSTFQEGKDRLSEGAIQSEVQNYCKHMEASAIELADFITFTQVAEKG